MHPKGIEFETEHRCQYNRESDWVDVPVEDARMCVHSHVNGRVAHEMQLRTLKDRKLSVGTAGTINQPMGMDSSGQVDNFTSELY